MAVKDLLHYLRERNPSITEEEVTDAVWSLAEAGTVALEDIPPATNSLRAYLGFWERNIDLYLALGISLITILTVFILPSTFPTVAFRWILGSIFLLFIPGFVLVEALFPKGSELDGIERLALSIGLSLALVPLVGLVLNYTPWGIRLMPMVGSLVAFTVGASAACFGRRFRMSVDASKSIALG